VGPRAGLDGCGKSPPPRLDPQTFQPVALWRYQRAVISAVAVVHPKVDPDRFIRRFFQHGTYVLPTLYIMDTPQLED
jgi:hypothetical protein